VCASSSAVLAWVFHRGRFTAQLVEGRRLFVGVGEAERVVGVARQGEADADGARGRVSVVLVAVDDRWLDSLLGDVRALAPTVYWTVVPLGGAAAVDAVTAPIHEIAPHTIVTFGPQGMTGHADHRAVAAWVVQAWQRSGQRALLLQATTTDRFATEFADVHDALPIFGPGLPERTGERDLAVAVRLDEELQDLKLAALRAQATQTQGLVAAIGEDRFRAWWREETFVTPGVASQLPPISTRSPRRLQGRVAAFRQCR
jgi:hypothetical protein